MKEQVVDGVDYCWRLTATGLAFAVFGLGGALLSVTAFPLIRAFSWSEPVLRRRVQRALHLTFRLFVGFMRTVGLLTYEVQGRERLLCAGQLIVANHPTLIDVVFLMSLVPDVGCVVKRGLWRNPFLRWPVLWAGYIPNHTGRQVAGTDGAGAQLVAACAASLKLGRSLIVFPEGTRTVPGQAPDLKRGAAQIALASGADVLPVSIVCEPWTLSKAEPWYRIPPRRPHFTLAVGQPVPAHFYHAAGEPPSVAARHLTAYLARYFARGIEAASQTEAAPAGSGAHAPHSASL